MKIAQVAGQDGFGDDYYYINHDGDIKYVIWGTKDDEIHFCLCQPDGKNIDSKTFMSCAKNHGSFGPGDALEALGYNLLEPQVACCIGENCNQHEVYVLLSGGNEHTVVAIPNGNYLGFHKIYDEQGDSFNPMSLFNRCMALPSEALKEAGYKILCSPELFKELIDMEYTGEQHNTNNAGPKNEKSFEERMRDKTDELFRKMW